MGIYSQNYDARNLDDNSIYKDYDRKDLVVEAEYLRAHLKIIWVFGLSCGKNL